MTCVARGAAADDDFALANVGEAATYVVDVSMEGAADDGELPPSEVTAPELTFDVLGFGTRVVVVPEDAAAEEAAVVVDVAAADKTLVAPEDAAAPPHTPDASGCRPKWKLHCV